jgi:predicted LPLAT superfamily acyltransferase
MTSATWTTVNERGASAGLWLTALFYRVFGRRLSAWFILPVVVYFFVTDRRGRRASRRYLERVYARPAGARALGHRPTTRDAFRHYYEFGLATIDRLRFTLGGRDVEVVLHGREHFAPLLAARRGAVLLGAHLGSFDALRVLAAREGITVNVLMTTRHAPRINAVLRRLNPDLDVRVIEPGGHAVDTAARLRACVERGEFVAILGDRVAESARARVVRAPFLGRPAAFPSGPFLLAGALGCPVLLMLGLRRTAAAYEVFTEPLADRVDLRRAERAERVADLARRYAARLEAYCVEAPYQWFNFFDFWDEERG